MLSVLFTYRDAHWLQDKTQADNFLPFRNTPYKPPKPFGWKPGEPPAYLQEYQRVCKPSCSHTAVQSW